MIATCRKCTGLFTPPPVIEVALAGLCPRCRAMARLVGVVDDLVAWSRSVDVVSGCDAAKRLLAITERAATVGNEARAL